MKKSQILLEQIDEYVLGNLSGSKLQDFEARMQKDSDFLNEVKRQQLIHKALSDKESMDFRKLLLNIDREVIFNDKNPTIKLTPDASSSDSSSWSFWKIASVLVIFMGLACAFWFWPSSRQDIFNQYYTPYPVADITRGENSVNSASINAVITDYKNKRYAKAIPLLEKEVTKSPTNDRLKLYLGNAYLNTKQEDKALSILKTINKESIHYQDAQWFTALSYLKLKSETEALPILKELLNTPNLYQQKVKELLAKLD